MLLLPHNEHHAGRMTHHALGRAAEQGVLDTRVAMRGDDDKIRLRPARRAVTPLRRRSSRHPNLCFHSLFCSKLRPIRVPASTLLGNCWPFFAALAEPIFTVQRLSGPRWEMNPFKSVTRSALLFTTNGTYRDRHAGRMVVRGTSTGSHPVARVTVFANFRMARFIEPGQSLAAFDVDQCVADRSGSSWPGSRRLPLLVRFAFVAK
jgi:hypothetical protein